jgi:hypothetical protein
MAENEAFHSLTGRNFKVLKNSTRMICCVPFFLENESAVWG